MKIAVSSRGQSWGAIAFWLCLAAAFPLSLGAQTSSPAGSQTSLSPMQGSAYGTSVQTPLRFEGEQVLENQATLSAGAAAFYDDNVQASNAGRVGDEAISLNSNLAVRKQTSHLALTFDYQPFFLIYRQISQYDRLNHDANINLAYRLSPRVILGLHDTFSYQNGVLPNLSGQTIGAGPPPPTGLNQGIFAYTTRTLSNVGGVSMTFVKSRRNSVTFSADYNQLKFGNQNGATESLYNGLGFTGGVQYQNRITDHTTFGVLALHEDTTYTGGVTFGDRLRTQIESGYVSFGSRLSPTLSITVFGGPQYVHVLGPTTGLNTLSGRVQEAGGISVTKQAQATALQFSFQRTVSDSGGVYTSVINTTANVGARRRLVGQWNLDLHGGVSRADASLFQQANGSTNAVVAGIEFSRPLRGEGSRLRISYDTTHQVSHGLLPIFADFDRNQVTVGVDFRIKAVSLGQ